jgi:hypothetical protein
VPRSIYEGTRDMARQIAKSREGRTCRELRKKVEMLFAQTHSQASGSDYEDRMVPAMSSSSQPPPKTCESWRN